MTRARRAMSPRRERGLSLIELVAVMVLLGIVSVTAMRGYQETMQAYRLARSQAELADALDTALRRIGRDVRSALPNSVRATSTGGAVHLELIATKNGGRYRGVDNGDILDADASVVETSFETLGALGTLPNQAVAANDRVVLMNLNSGSGTAELDDNAYNMAQAACTSGTYSTRCNVHAIASVTTGAASTTLTLAGSGRDFPKGSPAGRFAVVPASPGVTYACVPGAAAGGNGTGYVRRFANYVPALTQATPVAGVPPIGGTEAIVIENVSACSFQVRADLGVAYLQITVVREGASATLYHAIRVPSNA